MRYSLTPKGEITMDKVPMPSPAVRLTYARKGENFFGRAEIPTKNGTLRFAVLVPLSDIKQEVARYLAANPAQIAGDPNDPNIVGNLPRIYHNIAKKRAQRRLGTAIKAKFGGSIRPYEIAGSAGYAVRIAQTAANKLAWGPDVGAEIGLFGFVKKIGKAVGKGVVAAGKGIGKGVFATGKGIGKGAAWTGKKVAKGTVATGKGVLKVGKVVTSNPITRALISVVPYGGAALAVADAARRGSPGAQKAIAETQAAADAGNVIAQASSHVLTAATEQLNTGVNFAHDNPKSSAGMIAAVAGGLGLLLMLKKK